VITFFTAEALPAVRLGTAGPSTAAFVERGISRFRNAARFVASLPYGRNSNRADHLVVLRENKGTCSTKHSLLARLAQEQNLPIALCIGIYEMDGLNTPGVGAVLEEHGLTSIPEAHCYLKRGSKRFDVTLAGGNLAREPIDRVLVEVEISPQQVGGYKVQLHQEFIHRWMNAVSLPRAFTFAELWAAREACIHALETPT
jgi:hypothetical protein